jgi:hypothetical protein
MGLAASERKRWFGLGYSSFGIGVDRKHILKWLFLQGKATSLALEKSTCIPKML